MIETEDVWTCKNAATNVSAAQLMSSKNITGIFSHVRSGEYRNEDEAVFPQQG